MRTTMTRKIQSIVFSSLAAAWVLTMGATGCSDGLDADSPGTGGSSSDATGGNPSDDDGSGGSPAGGSDNQGAGGTGPGGMGGEGGAEGCAPKEGDCEPGESFICDGFIYGFVTVSCQCPAAQGEGGAGVTPQWTCQL